MIIIIINSILIVILFIKLKIIYVEMCGVSSNREHVMNLHISVRIDQLQNIVSDLELFQVPGCLNIFSVIK